jgi:hypothetical protein
MMVALRVLTAVADKRQQWPEDVEELCRLAPPGDYGSLDEMARRIVEDGIKRLRERLQYAAAGG